MQRHVIHIHLWSAAALDLEEVVAAARRDPAVETLLGSKHWALESPLDAVAAAREMRQAPWHWTLQQRVGTCLGDVWCTVAVLLAATKALPVVAMATDSDGDFLLIEACPGIPAWCAPDVATHRCALVGGAVCLVPPNPPAAEWAPLWEELQLAGTALADDADAEALPAPKPRGGSGPLPLPVAADVLLRAAATPSLFRAIHHAGITAATEQKAMAEVSALRSHRAVCVLPAAVAAVLEADPQLAHVALHAFADLGPDEAAAAPAQMAFFDPTADPVRVNVTLSRHVFALAHFVQLPTGCTPPDTLPEHVVLALGLGAKLTLGLDLLCRERGPPARRVGAAASASRDGLTTAVRDPRDVGDSTAWLEEYARAAAAEAPRQDAAFERWASGVATQDLVLPHSDSDDSSSSSDSGGTTDDGLDADGERAYEEFDQACREAALAAEAGGCPAADVETAGAVADAMATTEQIQALLAQFTA